MRCSISANNSKTEICSLALLSPCHDIVGSVTPLSDVSPNDPEQNISISYNKMLTHARGRLSNSPNVTAFIYTQETLLSS